MPRPLTVSERLWTLTGPLADLLSYLVLFVAAIVLGAGVFLITLAAFWMGG